MSPLMVFLYKMEKFDPEDRYLNINQLQLHYLDWGGHTEQPMLLLHGFMGHAHMWDKVALEFRNHYRVISLDQRGHGQSQWSQELAYSIDDHCSDICRFTEILGLYRMIVIGHSMGGRNALFYTACFPEKVERLILVDTRPQDSEQSSKALRLLLMHLPLQSDTLEEVVDSIINIYPLLPLDFAYHIARYGYEQAEHGKYVPKHDTRMNLQCQKSNYFTEDLWPFLSNISCPTLIVRGEKSPFLCKEDAKRIVNSLPRGVLKEIRHSTHMPVQENPEEFKAVIWDFLNSG